MVGNIIELRRTNYGNTRRGNLNIFSLFFLPLYPYKSAYVTPRNIRVVAACDVLGKLSVFSCLKFVIRTDRKFVRQSLPGARPVHIYSYILVPKDNYGIYGDKLKKYYFPFGVSV